MPENESLEAVVSPVENARKWLELQENAVKKVFKQNLCQLFEKNTDNTKNFNDKAVETSTEELFSQLEAKKRDLVIEEAFDTPKAKLVYEQLIKNLERKDLERLYVDLIIETLSETFTGWGDHYKPPSMEGIARELKNLGVTAITAFFLGNEKAKLFRDHEIEEIKSHLSKLQ